VARSSIQVHVSADIMPTFFNQMIIMQQIHMVKKLTRLLHLLQFYDLLKACC